MMTVHTEYTAYASWDFDLPEGRTWEDVDSYYVKWDMLYLTFKDGTDADIHICVDYDVETKRPVRTTITAEGAYPE